MNVLYYFEAMKEQVFRKSLQQLFPQEFFQYIPFENVRKGRCIICTLPMSQSEMHPQGAITPRAICPSCYQNRTLNNNIKECWVCGGGFDNETYNNQSVNPGDIHFRIHEYGRCRDYFSLLSAHALGIDTGIIELDNNEMQNILPAPPRLALPMPNEQPALGYNYTQPGQQPEVEVYEVNQGAASRPIGLVAKNCRR